MLTSFNCLLSTLNKTQLQNCHYPNVTCHHHYSLKHDYYQSTSPCNNLQLSQSKQLQQIQWNVKKGILCAERSSGQVRHWRVKVQLCISNYLQTIYRIVWIKKIAIYKESMTTKEEAMHATGTISKCKSGKGLVTFYTQEQVLLWTVLTDWGRKTAITMKSRRTMGEGYKRRDRSRWMKQIRDNWWPW